MCRPSELLVPVCSTTCYWGGTCAIGPRASRSGGWSHGSHDYQQARCSPALVTTFPLLSPSFPPHPLRYNISQLEEWSRTHGMVGSGVVEQLQPVVQAVKLLQMKKSNEEDVKTICELCSELNPLQVRTHAVSLPAHGMEELVGSIVECSNYPLIYSTVYLC